LEQLLEHAVPEVGLADDLVDLVLLREVQQELQDLLGVSSLESPGCRYEHLAVQELGYSVARLVASSARWVHEEDCPGVVLRHSHSVERQVVRVAAHADAYQGVP